MYLLTQTGFLSECVIYIDERWRSKGQVGKLEQYGYGYLLSQMAITPAIVSRLDHSGLFDVFEIDQLEKNFFVLKVLSNISLMNCGLN